MIELKQHPIYPETHFIKNWKKHYIGKLIRTRKPVQFKSPTFAAHSHSNLSANYYVTFLYIHLQIILHEFSAFDY